jgi:hypothetical protein
MPRRFIGDGGGRVVEMPDLDWTSIDFVVLMLGNLFW